jgi:hypothetical protein
MGHVILVFFLIAFSLNLPQGLQLGMVAFQPLAF